MSDCLNLLHLFSSDSDSKRNFCEGGTCLQAKNGLLEIDQMACFESPQSICRFIQNVSNESYFFFVPKFTKCQFKFVFLLVGLFSLCRTTILLSSFIKNDNNKLHSYSK